MGIGGAGTELISCDHMRRLEARVIQSGEVSGLDLMERAGKAVISAVMKRWPELPHGTQEALVLCGPGNNGGDGFVIARLLHRAGWHIDLGFMGDPEKLPPDARTNYDRWCEDGGVVTPIGALNDAQLDRNLVIDALFGIGMTRPLAEGVLPPDILMRWPARRVVAVDVPSGLNADNGVSMSPHFRADMTVTFHRPKPGHFLGDGPEHCGQIVVADIGLIPVEEPKTFWRAEVIDTVSTGALGKHLSHKYDYGHTLILSGGPGKGGAARLAARGALRIGAGLVTVAPPAAAIPENAARLDAIMVMPVDDGARLAAVLQDSRLNAICAGPGLGVERARDLVPEILSTGRSTVLDADVFTAFANDPAALFSRLHDRVVLTPHWGEFSRIFPDIAEKAQGYAGISRLEAVRAAAARAGSVLLLKGRDTVIAAPDGTARVHSAHGLASAPWLATAGSGDVLAGIIAGLMARGFAAPDAAATGVWLHAAAARHFGPGLISEDLPEQLPAVLRELRIA